MFYRIYESMQAPCQFVPCLGSVFIFSSPPHRLEIFQPGRHLHHSSPEGRSRVSIPSYRSGNLPAGSASTLILRKATNESRTATCGGVLEPNLYQRIGMGRKSLYGPARGLLERISILGRKEIPSSPGGRYRSIQRRRYVQADGPRR